MQSAAVTNSSRTSICICKASAACVNSPGRFIFTDTDTIVGVDFWKIYMHIKNNFCCCRGFF